MVALLATQRVQCTISGIPQTFLVSGLHQRVVHVITTLLRNVQLVAQFSDEANPQDSHVALVERIDLDAQNGSGVGWQFLLVAQIEIGDLLDDLAALRSLDRKYAQLFGVIGNDGT